MATKERVIGVIGAGSMGGALISGFVNKALISPEDIIVSDTNQSQLDMVSSKFPVRTTRENREVVNAASVVVLAVKPAAVKSVLEEVCELVTPDHLLISVAAGVRLAYLESHLPEGIPVIRAMPNLPALIGEGMTALALGRFAGEKEKEVAEKLFSAVGRVVVVSEENMNAVTGLSGCGPAYVAMIVEALADGGVKMGLPRRVAEELALQTLVGTARMLQSGGDHPGQLKDRVCSPGGSTIAGVHVLEKGGLRGLLMSAVEAATIRAGELQP
ncbi:MAG: pyrroline-5-carboxylate reductase [Thermacetogeniaceae bacterium]